MDSDNRLVIVIALAVLLYLLYRYQQRVFEDPAPPSVAPTDEAARSERPKPKQSPEMIDLESSYEPDSMLDSFDGSGMSSLLQSESPEPSWL